MRSVITPNLIKYLTKSSMEVYTDTEFLQKQFPDELYLCEPCIPLGGDVLLHGKRALGKTQLALTLAISVMEGTKWLGQYQALRGRVAYVQADMPKKLQQDRRRTLYKVTGMDYGDDFLHILSDSKVDILSAAHAREEWIRRLHQHDPVLVIVDTLRKTHPLDENSSDTPVAVYGAWRALVGQKATIVYVHHDRKTSEFGDLNESARGSGAWLDECDTGIHIIGKKKRLDRMEFSKLRTMDYPEPIPLRMNPETLLIEADTEEPVEKWVRQQIAAGKPKAEIVAGATDASRWDKAMSRKTAYRRLEGYQDA